ncbi:Gfo/Idh/MocA family oxidoreductase [Ponticoccus sp. SC2-23]|uniref:Gfo/Idh/MocA family protein n=1 Tax=Alexandriicola marinus TaxID=2081710 RepID=UPI000FD700E2|nr:Gfo/Idh/MocA family oxidoreductase [Alexandriicola marinus]MBM1222427.1 Gfo/Idh/MocA family oxidoreductase [Ponticoccus sp. SC6-9]MBM1224540.1 Gfo/Idh/MocA family oxidoreductase [Ponticoccus sp. SC6-15]MBM1229680.1 Gfo/Idh/MocA family oxidoreductase [Ponticoccus sp. SC6-38]MBM1233506.1 Gfo/Idh/MocA family oxidoreductase [Ponticoccus sp. SC6-45]MBM1236544.1 Gfo/Idh/MocA family oxidoreductase [Ponticoccus sp. SC6-49]MBM1244588.1 Gfo/Idh/MocA family oxidoreductase [Ponticoccus sp. SC2-64]MBM
MIGGGQGAYIGNIHRIAARLDGQWDLVAGAFDVDPQRGRDFAIGEGLDPARAYGSYQDLIAGEAGRDDKVDAVAICTPNFTHYPIAKALIDAGFDVICEKPLTATLEDAIALEKLARERGSFVGVTYTYSGYPMVHEARVRVANGELGKIRTIQVEYPLEWMATAIESEGNAQAAWRTDPTKNGRGGSIGDIGTHAYHLAGFVTGLTVEALTADLATFVPGRALDDNAHVMIRYEGGARGLLWSSQVALGNSNGVRLRVFGSEGSLQWFQEQPNELIFQPLGGRVQTIKRGTDEVSEDAKVRSRTPPGHPEGYLEAFANLYAGFAEVIRARRAGRDPGSIGQNVPLAYDGLKGVAFVEAVVDSAESDLPVWLTPVAT